MSDSMGRYKRVYRTMIEDTTTGYRHGKSGTVKYESTKKGKRLSAKKRGKK